MHLVFDTGIPLGSPTNSRREALVAQAALQVEQRTLVVVHVANLVAVAQDTRHKQRQTYDVEHLFGI